MKNCAAVRRKTMPEYSVLFHSEATFIVQVEAESADEAEEFCEYGLHHDNVDASTVSCVDIYGGCEGVICHG